MIKIFSGKTKLFTLPLGVLLGIAFLPFTVGILFGWLVHKKVNNKSLRYSLFTIITLFTLFIGSAWLVAMASPTRPVEKVTTPPQVEKLVTSISTEVTPSLVVTTVSPTPFVREPAPNNPSLVLAKVVAVVDGDTIDVDMGEGNIKRVRYIGINTPESVDPRKPIQCYSKEATAKNSELVDGVMVGLEKDVSETDRYGRLLRYVYLGDMLVNQVLVAEGYAYATSYPPDVKYQDIFKAAEQQARIEKKGLWKSCDTSVSSTTQSVSPSPVMSNILGSSSSTTTQQSGGCRYSCTGPDRDCSDFSSHGEAQTFFSCCGFTAENDPMKLDAVGVGDGIACENI
jgi:micrococcal nuclease